MYVETISERAQASLKLVGQTPLATQFYLGGGTAVALYLGHRQSDELDFFSLVPFRKDEPRRFLAHLGQLTVEREDEGAFRGVLNGVCISFIIYPYYLVAAPVMFGRTRVAALRDLVVMSLDAVASRGEKRDFLDLYFICQDYTPLQEMFPPVERNHKQGVEYNFMYLLKSLMYFENAEADPMPEMLRPVSWPDVRRFFEREAQDLFRHL
jgi:hypothetical protein